LKKGILITGCAGFIGYHIANKLIYNSKYNIIGVDNVNNYYDVSLKKARLKKLSLNKNFIFFKLDINNKNKISNLCKKFNIKYIINLAAQAGIRYSYENPSKYFNANLKGLIYLKFLEKIISSILLLPLLVLFMEIKKNFLLLRVATPIVHYLFMPQPRNLMR